MPLMSALFAKPAPSPAGGRLVSVDGAELPLVGARIDAVAGGGQARVALRQTFVNDGTTALDVTYKVPLPADGAVSGYRFALGDTVVEGEVHRRADARAQFEEAVLSGRTAALLEEETSSLFTQSIGNLPPGATLEVTLTIDHPLAWRDEGGWEWRFPTVVAPRYLGNVTPIEAAKRQVDVADGDIDSRFSLSLRIADDVTQAPTSPSHTLGSEGGTLHVAGATLDRDAVVRWGVGRAEPGVTARVARPEGDGHAYVRLNLVPPLAAPERGVARDLVVLVDVSGSMAGEPLAQARKVLDALIAGLGPHDQVELVEFSSSAIRWRPGPTVMDATGRAEARRWVARLAAGGCTEMYTGICEALRTAPREGAQRQVLLVTDGYIGNEGQIVERVLLERPTATRVHTLGVGSAVNRTLTEWVARAGGGVEQIVAPGEDASEAVRTLLARTATPLIVDLEVSGEALVDGLPFRLPDLFAGAPATLYARVEASGGTLVVRGRGPHGPWAHEVAIGPVEAGQGEPSIATCWARQRVADLELGALGGQPQSLIEAEITRIGLEYRLATAYTSWLAVTRKATVDGLAPKRRVEQPHAVPADVSIEHFGLRPASEDGYGGGMRGLDSTETRSLAPSLASSLAFDADEESFDEPAGPYTGQEVVLAERAGKAEATRDQAPMRSAARPDAARSPLAAPSPPVSLPEPVEYEPAEARASVGPSGLLRVLALLTLPIWGPFLLLVWLWRWLVARWTGRSE